MRITLHLKLSDMATASAGSRDQRVQSGPTADEVRAMAELAMQEKSLPPSGLSGLVAMEFAELENPRPHGEHAGVPSGPHQGGVEASGNPALGATASPLGDKSISPQSPGSAPAPGDRRREVDTHSEGLKDPDWPSPDSILSELDDIQVSLRKRAPPAR
jgi:hypothetical protein